MLNRRSIIVGAACLPAFSVLPHEASAHELAMRLQGSRLIYLTPIKSNGEESACKGEVWFQYHAGDIYVVTQAEAWRAEAVRKGLSMAKVWVGEFGVWTDADEAFRDAPELMLKGTLETNSNAHASVLDAMGLKYSDEWGVWGPRFRDGLKDGSRVMLRYKLT